MLLEQRSVISCVIIKEEKKKKIKRKEEKRWVLINICSTLYLSWCEKRKENREDLIITSSFFARKKTSALEISEDAFTPTILAAIVFFFRSLSPHAQPAIPLSSLRPPLLLLLSAPCLAHNSFDNGARRHNGPGLFHTFHHSTGFIFFYLLWIYDLRELFQFDSSLLFVKI